MPALSCAHCLLRAPVPAVLVVLAVCAALACSEPEQPVAALRASPPRVSLPFSQSASIELIWTPLAPRSALGDRPLVFVHLVDQEESLLRTFDHPLDIEDWSVGVATSHPLELTHSYLAPHFEAGEYRLTAGLYDPEGIRFALRGDGEGEGLAGYEHVVATVLIPDSRPTSNIAFLGDWRPLENAGDLQRVRHRWMGADSRLEIAPIREPQRLGLELQIPIEIESSVPNSSAAPGVQVSNSCGQGQQVGPGRHRIDLELEPGPDETDCVVELAPSVVWKDDRGTTRSVSLQGLTLTPAIATADQARLR